MGGGDNFRQPPRPQGSHAYLRPSMKKELNNDQRYFFASVLGSTRLQKMHLKANSARRFQVNMKSVLGFLYGHA